MGDRANAGFGGRKSTRAPNGYRSPLKEPGPCRRSHGDSPIEESMLHAKQKYFAENGHYWDGRPTKRRTVRVASSTCRIARSASELDCDT